MNDRSGNPTVAVIGGGLAGLAAAVAAGERGLQVELFEQGKRLGGRAGSFVDPKTGLVVDQCLHAAMGCCTNLLDFCHRTGTAGCFRRERKLHFFAPDGSQHDFVAARLLPAPLHLLPALWRQKYLSLGERWGIARALGRLGKSNADTTVAEWLRQQRQSERMIERFWAPVLVSALSETLQRASLAAAAKVFLDGFLGARTAWEVLLPEVPLQMIFDQPMRTWLAEHDVGLHLGTAVRQIVSHDRRASELVLADGSTRAFDFFLVAVPWHRTASLLPESLREEMPELAKADQLPSAPITAVHLWFDRPITPLPHAVLLGKLSQWLFAGGQHDLPHLSKSAHYYQVVISASHELIGRDREDILAEVRNDLETLWPTACKARLLHWRIVTQPRAVFSVCPSVESFRPTQQTPWDNLILAGDWTSTGWPATMEGAVRSGYLAAEALLRQLGREERILVPDLQRSWLAKRLYAL